jgi:hypothetical protein
MLRQDAEVPARGRKPQVRREKVQDVKYDFKVDNSIAAVENNPDTDPEGPCLASVRYEYRYDGLNRLAHAKGMYEKTRATAPGVPGDPLPPYGDTTVKKFELGYGYSPNGNLTGKTIYDADSGVVDDAWSYTYDNHAATAISTLSAGARFFMQYDAAGNMVLQTDSTTNLAKQMAYDSYNRIRQVTDQYTGTIKGRYWYDDQGPLSDLLSSAAFPTSCGSLPRAPGDDHAG